MSNKPAARRAAVATPPEAPSDVVSDATMDSILDAAEVCFERYGLRRTSMEDVADAAGMSRNGLYRAVGSREKLILATAVRRAERFIQASTLLAGKRTNARTAIVDYIVAAVMAGRREPVFHLFVTPGQSERGLSEDEARRTAIEITRQIWDAICKLVDTPKIRAVDPDDASVWLYATIQAMWALGDTVGTEVRVRELVTKFAAPTLAGEA